jgi:hypothetical protein
LIGTTIVLEVTGAAAICCAFTATGDLATGCELTKVVRETAVTPPGTVLFTYLMFVLLIFVLLMVVLLMVVLLMFVTWLLYTFVIVVVLTFVLLTFTRST